MNLFHTPLSAVTYEDLLAFCATFTEGVRVEYKREPAHIPKVVSSFANTVGGVWVVGVDAEKKTNRAVLPPHGIDGVGVEEQIVQAAQTGIYPPITPAVRVFPLPEKPGRVIAAVKVDESIEAPHAIENRTRVYIRTESTTDPYDLADIDRIDFLLRRRQQPEQRREQMIADMAARSWVRRARSRIVVAPMYPRGILLPMDDLVSRLDAVLKMSGSRLALDTRRLIQSGILSTGLDPAKPTFHFEADVHGLVFYEAPLRVNGHVKNYDNGAEIPFVYLQTLVTVPTVVVNLALALLRGSLTNVLLRHELLEWNGTGFLHAAASQFIEPGAVAQMQSCLQSHVIASVPATLEGLADRRTGVMTELMRQTLFAFNYRSNNLHEAVGEILREARAM